MLKVLLCNLGENSSCCHFPLQADPSPSAMGWYLAFLERKKMGCYSRL